MNNVKILSLALFLSFAFVGCVEDLADESNSDYYEDDSPSSSGSSGNACVGDQTPYNDPQLDTQCQTACVYLEASHSEGVSATCGILSGWENHADMRASDCPACGNTSSSNSDYTGGSNSGSTDGSTSGSTDSSNTGSTTDTRSQLCTKTTSTYLYTSCTGNNRSCDADYTYRGTYSSQSECSVAAEAWLDQSRKISKSTIENITNLKSYYDASWTHCANASDMSTTCTTDTTCSDDSYALGTYKTPSLCTEASAEWLKSQDIEQIKIGISKKDVEINGNVINLSISDSKSN